MFITLGECDVKIGPSGIELRWIGHGADRYRVTEAPGMVRDILERGGLQRVDRPCVAGLRDVPCSWPQAGSMDLCAWLLPEADALRPLRHRTELPPAPRAHPGVDKFALPEAAPAYVPPTKHRDLPFRAPARIAHRRRRDSKI